MPDVVEPRAAVSPDENQLSLIPFVARCGYCGAQVEVPTRELADRWAREHFGSCGLAPASTNRRRL